LGREGFLKNPKSLGFSGVSWLLQAMAPFTPEGFRVKTKIRQQLADRQRRIARRLDKTDVPNCQRPSHGGPGCWWYYLDRGANEVFEAGAAGIVRKHAGHP
jgi:hypothetical protein